jgi:hypothetical protein
MRGLIKMHFGDKNIFSLSIPLSHNDEFIGIGMRMPIDDSLCEVIEIKSVEFNDNTAWAVCLFKVVNGEQEEQEEQEQREFKGIEFDKIYSDF